jgi:hypothetical protein
VSAQSRQVLLPLAIGEGAPPGLSATERMPNRSCQQRMSFRWFTERVAHAAMTRWRDTQVPKRTSLPPFG